MRLGAIFRGIFRIIFRAAWMRFGLKKPQKAAKKKPQKKPRGIRRLRRPFKAGPCTGLSAAACAPESAVFHSCFDSSQARQTVRWGRFRGLLFAPAFAAKLGLPSPEPPPKPFTKRAALFFESAPKPVAGQPAGRVASKSCRELVCKPFLCSRPCRENRVCLGFVFKNQRAAGQSCRDESGFVGCFSQTQSRPELRPAAAAY